MQPASARNEYEAAGMGHWSNNLSKKDIDALKSARRASRVRKKFKGGLHHFAPALVITLAMIMMLVLGVGL